MNRQMDEGYAELSLRVGVACGAADHFLGGTAFRTRLREKRWELTSELFDQLKQEAIALGVPADSLDLTASQEASLPQLVATGMRMQKAVDDGDDVIIVWSDGAS